MESLCLEEENMIKDIRNLFRLKKNKITLQLTVQENLFRKEKETKQLKIEYQEKLRIFLSIQKKKKTIINQ